MCFLYYYTTTYVISIISLILPLGLKDLKYFLSDPLEKKFTTHHFFTVVFPLTAIS